MEILYFFQENNTPMFQWQRIHFIDELQHHGCRFSCFNPLKYETPQQANEDLIALINKLTYDLFFTNVGYEKVLFPETIDYIKAKGIPTLCLRCDNLAIPFNDKVLAPHFDLVWLTSIETKYLYDRWGVNSFFAPYAANPFFFIPTKIEQNERKVCFIGTPYGSRSIMINQLSTHGLPIDVYYKKDGRSAKLDDGSELKSDLIWPSRNNVLFHRLLFPQGRKILLGSLLNRISGQQMIVENDYLSSFPSVPAEEMSKIYSSYALSLSSTSTNHTDVLKKPLKVINLRSFEIPMSGGLAFCKFNQELADYFEDGKEIVFYSDNEELVDKANFYLYRVSDTVLFKMKCAARNRAESDHTWWNRFTIAFDKLGLKYEHR